jgi:pimeloyl-ACP methyl ester carboxylesterase
MPKTTLLTFFLLTCRAMKPKVLVPLVLLVVWSAAPGVAASDGLWGALQPGRFDVGFRLLEEVDRSRAIQPGGSAGRTHPRPVRVYVWYPASLSDGAQPMRFERYAEAADEDVWPDEILGRARERMKYAERPFARSLGPERFEELLKQPVRAVENAEAATGRFPLIVIGQGLYYESPVSHATLSEYLASRGFVVATCPLVGTHSPLVSLDVIDLETQVRDMEFVIARARAESFVSQERLGVFGFDMGGMAAVVLAMRNLDVDAFASVDAGILYGHLAHIPSGIPFTSPDFDPRRLRTPWLHATQRVFAQPPPGQEGPSLFEEAKYSDRYLVLVDGMRHVDFTSYALIEGKEPIRGYWPPEQGGERSRYEAVSRYVSRFFRAYLARDVESREFLARDPEETVPGISLTVEHQPAAAAGRRESDLRNALLTGDSSAVWEIALEIRENRAHSPMLEESVLVRLGYHLLSSWNMVEEGIAVFRICTEVHPRSANAWITLGDGYLWTGDREQAASCMMKALELEPDNERAKRILESLQGPSE